MITRMDLRKLGIVIPPDKPPVAPAQRTADWRHYQHKFILRGAGETPTGVVLEIPLMTISTKNRRENRWDKALRTKNERNVVAVELRCVGASIAKHQPPYLVKLKRLGPKELDDDNLRRALSAVRDSVAAHLGLDDADPLIRFEYDQQSSSPYGVRIEIESVASAPTGG